MGSVPSQLISCPIAKFCAFGHFRSCPGLSVGLSWRSPGAPLGLPWGFPGASLGSLGCPGPFLGLSWGFPGGFPGVSWGFPGLSVGLRWGFLGLPRASPGFPWGFPGASLGLPRGFPWPCSGPPLARVRFARALALGASANRSRTNGSVAEHDESILIFEIYLKIKNKIILQQEIKYIK